MTQRTKLFMGSVCLYALALPLFGSAPLPGGKVGNGGDVRVCRNAQQNITEIELYDFYEARTKREQMNLDISLGDDTVTVREKVAIALGRLEHYMPDLAKALMKRAEQILPEAKGVAVYLNNIVLEDIPDTDTRYWPSDCVVEQIAVREEPEFKGDPTFIFDNDLWLEFDLRAGGKDQQAGLILHEVIYELFAGRGQKNSRLARFLNSLLVSSTFEQMPSRDVWEIFSQMPLRGMRYFRVFNLDFRSVEAVKFEKDGSFKGTSYVLPDPLQDQFVHVQGKAYAIDTGVCHCERVRKNDGLVEWRRICEGSVVEFYSDGALKSFTPRQASYFRVGDIDVQTNSAVRFFPDGTIAHIVPRSKQIKLVVRDNNELSFIGELEFHPNGNVKSGILNSSQELTVHGQKLKLQGIGPGEPRSLSNGSVSARTLVLLGEPQASPDREQFKIRFHANGILARAYLAESGYVWSSKQQNWVCIISNGTTFNGADLREFTLLQLKEDGFLLHALFKSFGATPVSWF